MPSKWIPWLLALCVLALSAAPRWILRDTTPHPAGSWFVSDPDSLYHARRVERDLREAGLPAPTDPFLNHPEGAIVPWPPYYDRLASWVLGPFVQGEDPGELDLRAIERGVGSLPFLFGVLTSLLTFAAARQLAGNLAGFLAGGLHALAMGSVVYSRVGNGDHHAFYAMLSGWILWGVSYALGNGRLDHNRRALLLGSGLGLLIGVAIGSWVAALLLVLVIDAVLAILLFLPGRRNQTGLWRFGLSLHGVALLVLLPAVLQSPWKEEFPWMVVNLSWFHLVFLGIGALVFVPLPFLKERPRALARYPWIVGAVLLLLALLGSMVERGPIDGILEGFAWVSRQDTFMANIDESRPLFGTGAVPDGVSLYLGAFAWLMPLAWVLALARLLRGASLELLPWVVALPPLLLQALGQVRFTDTLIGPGSILVAWFLFTQLPWNKLSRARALAFPALLALVCLSQGTTCMRVWSLVEGGKEDRRPKRARRALCEWIREHRPGDDRAVLAPWGFGHEIEWSAGRPSVATNFGSYVGVEGYLAPARFFLSLDPAEAEAVLEERQADLVLFSSGLSSGLPGWMKAGPEEWTGRYYRLDAEGRGQLLRPWFESVGGQLLNDGFPRVPRGEQRGDSLDFLRLIHVSPTQLAQTPISSWKGPAPYGWIWERVPGARVVFEGEPGTPVAVEIELSYTGPKGRPLQAQRFLVRGTIGPDGTTRLRVPYSTESSNGDGQVERAAWRRGAARGTLTIPEHAVREGRDVRLSP